MTILSAVVGDNDLQVEEATNCSGGREADMLAAWKAELRRRPRLSVLLGQLAGAAALRGGRRGGASTRRKSI